MVWFSGSIIGLYGGDLREVQEINARADALRAVLQNAARNKRILAILDGAVDDQDDAKLAPLLRAFADCAVVVTSRARRLGSFHDAWLIDLDPLSEEETWDLFARVLGANDARPQVMEIGKTVEFLPMALDLAAHQLKDDQTWSLPYLLGLLRDELRQLSTLHWGGDDSERSIRASIRVSYKRLADDEQKFLDALGAFAGNDFDANAAAAVGETDLETAQKHLQKLRRLSVIQAALEPERYKLHTLVRTFAREQLRHAQRESAASLRMATHYCDFAKYFGPRLEGSEGLREADVLQAKEALDREVSNIFAGQGWARENETREARELTRDYIVELAPYFGMRANWAEWIEWSDFGIAACEKLDDERGAGTIAGDLGLAYADKGEWDRAIELYQKDLEISERLGDVQGMAQTFGNLGYFYRARGNLARALEYAQNALDIFKRLGAFETAQAERQLEQLKREMGTTQ